MLFYSIRSKTTRKVADTFVLQHRLRHQPPNRNIEVQLLANVQGLGKSGSIQSVAPGRMRSVLHPQKKAVYLLKHDTAKLPSVEAQEPGMVLPSQDEVDFAIMKSRLETLVPLVFRRPLNISAQRSLAHHSAIGQAIQGSVTLQDVAQRLNDTYNLSLVPPDAVLTFQEKNMKRIRKTGTFITLVHLKSRDIITLTIQVEPERTSTEKAQPLQGHMLVEGASQ